MKKLALAAAVALSPNFAEAQCAPRSDVMEAWDNIPTNQVFEGFSDKGVIVEIFENPENGRWSFYFTRATQPDVMCLFDQGQGANSTHETFTSPARLNP